MDLSDVFSEVILRPSNRSPCAATCTASSSAAEKICGTPVAAPFNPGPSASAAAPPTAEIPWPPSMTSAADYKWRHGISIGLYFGYAIGPRSHQVYLPDQQRRRTRLLRVHLPLLAFTPATRTTPQKRNPGPPPRDFFFSALRQPPKVFFHQTTKIFVDTTNSFVVQSPHMTHANQKPTASRTRNPASPLDPRPFHRPRSPRSPQRKARYGLHQRLKAHADHDRKGQRPPERNAARPRI